MTKRFVITGCGRSGTTYIARLLSELGCPCNHEVFFTGSRPGRGTELMARLGARELRWSSPTIGEAAWEAAPWLPLMPDDTHVLHQLRHPLEFIRSRQKKGWVHGRFRSRHLPHFPRMNKARFAALPLPEQADWLARFWIDWNALVEERARGKSYLRYRIEDFDLAKLNEMLTWIQFPHDPDTVEQVFSQLPTNVNTRGQKRDDITLNLLPEETRSNLASAAKRYGYHL
ncbi:sulfotransferase family protein [Microbulbifer sp. HZ11]|uniref:sulfotransferase family protein n=1 Tax=unclassified Microbulbifer TaxID=2619833 RepID=UPI0005BA3457|nr:sulfotransferase family protein [Microbulbifer sp. HZ11]